MYLVVAWPTATGQGRATYHTSVGDIVERQHREIDRERERDRERESTNCENDFLRKIKGRKMPGAPTYNRRCHWNNWKYGASKLTLPYLQALLQKLCEIWARALKKICQTCLWPREYKEYRFEGRLIIISLPRASTYLGPAYVVLSLQIPKRGTTEMKCKLKGRHKVIDNLLHAYSKQLHVSAFYYSHNQSKV
jgi:hypothetical protein